MLGCMNTPQSIGLAYIEMANVQWRRGHALASQACFQKAGEFLPMQVVAATMQIARLLGAGESARLSAERVRDVLKTFGIPEAPTNEVGSVLVDVARASLDEGIFRVAREAMYLLVGLTRDDIFHGMLRSIEAEPDR